MWILLCCAPGRAWADEFLHPALARGKGVIKSLLVLPPRAVVARVGLRGNEPRPADAARIEEQLVQLVEGAVRQHVWNARVVPFEAPTDSDARYALGDIQDRYDRLAAVMHRKRRGVARGSLYAH